MEFVRGDGVGKNDRVITTDNSCFDVYVEYENTDNQTGSIGIEVKYTEPFSNSDYWSKTGYVKDRYIYAIEKILVSVFYGACQRVSTTDL